MTVHGPGTVLRRGRYGIDAPHVPVFLGLLGLGVLAGAVVGLVTGGPFSG